MHPLRCLVVGAAVAAVMSLGAAGSVAAGKGGNDDTAKLCNQGGWKLLLSRTGDPFSNQGDCVNDGAHGIGAVPDTAGWRACNQLVRSSYSPSGGHELWMCVYPVPPNPSEPQTLEVACKTDVGDDGTVVYAHGTVSTAVCVNPDGTS